MSRFTIKHASQITGVSASTIRNWERRGFIRARRDWRRARVFSPEDLERLMELAGTDGRQLEGGDPQGTIRIPGARRSDRSCRPPGAKRPGK